MISNATGMADEDRRRAGEQVDLAGRRQSLLPEHDQPGGGRAGQRGVGDPAPRRGDPAAGGRARIRRGPRPGGCGTTTRPAAAGRPARPRRSGPPATRPATRPARGGQRRRRPTPAAAAGSTTAAPPARAAAASCRSEAPRARIMVNSPRRCSATSRAPSSTTTAAIAARRHEQQRQHALHRVIGGHKGREDRDQAIAEADLDRGGRARRGAEAGPHGRGRGQVGEALEDLQQPGRLVGRDTAQVERETPQGPQRLGARVALQGGQVRRTHEGGRAPVGHGIRRRVGQPGRRGDRVRRPEGRSGADGPEDPGDHHRAGRWPGAGSRRAGRTGPRWPR